MSASRLGAPHQAAVLRKNKGSPSRCADDLDRAMANGHDPNLGRLLWHAEKWRLLADEAQPCLDLQFLRSELSAVTALQIPVPHRWRSLDHMDQGLLVMVTGPGSVPR